MGGLPGLIKLSDMSEKFYNKKFFIAGPSGMKHFPRILMKPYLSNTNRIELTLPTDELRKQQVYEKNGIHIVMIELKPSSCPTLDDDNFIRCPSVAVYIGQLVNNLTSNSSYIDSSTHIGSNIQFVVLECPSLQYVSPLVSHPLLQQGTHLNPKVIVHMTPLRVLKSEAYKKWMNGFGSNTKHILLNSDVCPMEMSVPIRLKMQLSLHTIDNKIFQLPHLPDKICWVDDKFGNSNNSIIVGRYLFKFDLISGIPEYDSNTPLNYEALKEFSVDNQHLPFNQQISKGTSRNVNHNCQQSNTKLTFLGGGLSSNCDYRSVNSILLHLANGEYMMLDAGEGTLCQLYKCFGPVIADDVIRKLKCIFVSHIHADHSLGLVSILQKRNQLLNGSDYQSTLVIGPKILYEWLTNYGSYCEDIRFRYLKFSFKAHSNKPLNPSHSLFSSGITSLTLVPVLHCAESYGIVLKHRDGWKLVYSGDTRPSRDLVRAGKNATLLIHEATFTHNLLKKAIVSKHSTDIEAIKVAKDMNADYVILTHFGETSRMKLHKISNHLSSCIGVAFDFMTICLDSNNMQHLQNISPRIKQVLTTMLEK